MASLSLNEYARRLASLRLVDPDGLQQCLQDLPRAAQTADGLTEALQRRNLLTNYQLNKLNRGETDALVLGDARLLYRNGSGSFARVFRAVSLENGKMLGIKLLRQRWASDPEAVAQFHREARLIQPMRHPNIVPIYEVGTKGDFHFFTMEFIVGGNLGDMMRIRQEITMIDATRCALGIAEGLRYALSKGISHRDLKRTNVLLDTNGLAKLVDFGLAADEALQPGGKKKKAQRALEYATLEDGTGAPANDHRSDLYFLGTIYYELLAGRPPYPRARSRVDRQQFSRLWNVLPISDVRPDLPGDIVNVVERLMHLNPDHRYQQPEDACAALADVLQGLQRPSETDAAEAEPAGESEVEPTLMFVEHRPDQQRLLREFFTKRGFRVLLLGDMQRALNRLKSSPPDCLVLMGGSVGHGILEGFRSSLERAGDRPLAHIAVLSKDQDDLQRRFDDCVSSTARVLTHPLVLGNLKQAIEETLACRDGQGH